MRQFMEFFIKKIVSRNFVILWSTMVEVELSKRQESIVASLRARCLKHSDKSDTQFNLAAVVINGNHWSFGVNTTRSANRGQHAVSRHAEIDALSALCRNRSNQKNRVSRNRSSRRVSSMAETVSSVQPFTALPICAAQSWEKRESIRSN